MTPSTEAIRPSDFGLEVDYVPNSENPARVFKTMTRLIEAFEMTDEKLAAALGGGAQSVVLLQRIEAGSITTWLQSVLQTIDDEALKSGDLKKIVGAYLVQGKGAVVRFLHDRTTIESADEVYDLQSVIRDAAREVGMPMSSVPNPPVPAIDVAQSIRMVSEATSKLIDGDTAKYISSAGVTEINKSFRVTPEKIEEVLTQESITNEDEMILKVRKPDFLGDSMWEFRHEGKKLPVRVTDVGWLRDFHEKKILIGPGDALRGIVEVVTKYGYDKEVIATHHSLRKVQEIIQRK